MVEYDRRAATSTVSIGAFCTAVYVLRFCPCMPTTSESYELGLGAME